MSEGRRIGALSRLTAGLALLFLACSEPTGPGAGTHTSPPGVTGGPIGSGPSNSSSDGSDVPTTLLACPTNVTQSATELISPLLGGTVSVAGSSVTLSKRFIDGVLPVPVTLTVPASQYVEVNVTIAGLEHLTFPLGATATIAIDYSRCSRTDLTQRTLAAWNIDPLTDALLEFMGGTDDKDAQTVTFTTGHLSSYAVAF